MSARRRRTLTASPSLAQLIVLSLGTGGACVQPKAAVQTPEIVPHAGLRPGDELDIRVFDEDRFNGTYAVAEDGTIDFPMVGGVPVTGLTKDEVARQIEARLADGYLNHPHV